MQVKIFTLPIMGGEKLLEELNVFLRSHKILHVERQIATSPQGVFWAFCINYLDENHPTATAATFEKGKIDYRDTLDAPTFARFSKMRELRKQLAQEENIPAYAVFRDDELACMAQLEILTLATIQSVKGIGEKKGEKYGQRFIIGMTDAASK